MAWHWCEDCKGKGNHIAVPFHMPTCADREASA